MGWILIDENKQPVDLAELGYGDYTEPGNQFFVAVNKEDIEQVLGFNSGTTVNRFSGRVYHYATMTYHGLEELICHHGGKDQVLFVPLDNPAPTIRGLDEINEIVFTINEPCGIKSNIDYDYVVNYTRFVCEYINNIVLSYSNENDFVTGDSLSYEEFEEVVAKRWETGSVSPDEEGR